MIQIEHVNTEYRLIADGILFIVRYNPDTHTLSYSIDDGISIAPIILVHDVPIYKIQLWKMEREIEAFLQRENQNFKPTP